MNAKTTKSSPTSSPSIMGSTSWMLMAEGCARASRLVAVIALAAALGTAEYGVAMLALVSHELVRLLSRLGAGTRVVQCSDAECESLAGNAYVLNWLVSLLIAGLQFVLAPKIAAFFAMPQLTLLLQWMAVSYLFYPLVAIHVAWLQRQQCFRAIALVTAAAVASDNLSTALFAVMGAGLMSVAYAKIVAAVIWVAGFVIGFVIVQKRANLESKLALSPRFEIARMRELVQFSVPVFCNEALKTLRNQIDILLAGKLLAPELFGLYSFAKSAGVGFALSLSQAYNTVIYPHLAKAFRDGQLANKAKQLALPTSGICALFLVQAALAPWYVELLFGHTMGNNSATGDFASGGNLVALLCLAAIPMLLIDIFAVSLRIRFALYGELMIQLAAIAVIAATIVLVAPVSATHYAGVTVAAYFMALPVSLALYVLFVRQSGAASALKPAAF